MRDFIFSEEFAKVILKLDTNEKEAVKKKITEIFHNKYRISNFIYYSFYYKFEQFICENLAKLNKS